MNFLLIKVLVMPLNLFWQYNFMRTMSLTWNFMGPLVIVDHFSSFWQLCTSKIMLIQFVNATFTRVEILLDFVGGG